MFFKWINFMIDQQNLADCIQDLMFLYIYYGGDLSIKGHYC